MKQFLFSLFLFSSLLSTEAYSHSQLDSITVAFWNLENLFDTVDDPDKVDEEFLPTGTKEWTDERLDKKLYNLSRVIRLMNPDILGVCEVEHQYLLDTLVTKFLNERNYKTAYSESPDNRGIDNGLIYNSDLFTLISVNADTVKLEDGYPTRLILGVNLLTKYNDTLHIYINHWPSRRGGEVESEPNRINAAETLRKAIDKNLLSDPDSKIIILGDFNDEPGNVSLSNHLNASPFYCDSTENPETTLNGLLNISYPDYADGFGSYKYRDDWNMLDQIIVSGSLLYNEKFHYICGTFEVNKPYILVTHSGKYEGTAFPTYGGNRYLGGYSDHFPVTSKFILKSNR